jgi:hypothetical protein
VLLMVSQCFFKIDKKGFGRKYSLQGSGSSIWSKQREKSLLFRENLRGNPSPWGALLHKREKFGGQEAEHLRRKNKKMNAM